MALREQDEKALRFLLTVPQQWRLFWALESIGISFALAPIAIVYVGDSSPFLERNIDVLKQWPTWFLWAFNPAVVTLCSVIICSAFKTIGDFVSEQGVSVDDPAVGVTDARAFVTFGVAITKAKAILEEDLFFYATLAIWLAQAVHGWFLFTEHDGFPVAFYVKTTSPRKEHGRVVLTDNKLVMQYSIAILAIGLALKAVGVLWARDERVAGIAEFPHSSQWCGLKRVWGRCANSRVSSLLVGWGIGYWVISLLHLLACSWPGSDHGWTNAPIAITVISFIIIPCFLLSCVFMVADTNFLGARFGALVKPVAEKIRNKRRAEYWVMASVFRDFIVCWMGYCMFLSNTFS